MIALLHLTSQDEGRPLTWDEFQRASAQDGYRYELIDGKLEVSPYPSMSHSRLATWLGELLIRYIRRHSEIINEVVWPAFVVVPDRPAATAPQSDLAAYHDFPVDLYHDEPSWQDVSPILVVEVLSPDSADKDFVRNLELYLQVPSIREYWINDPRTSASRPTMTVYRRRGQKWQKPIQVPGGGTYNTRLLPGFTLLLDRRR